MILLLNNNNLSYKYILFSNCNNISISKTIRLFTVSYKYFYNICIIIHLNDRFVILHMKTEAFRSLEVRVNVTYILLWKKIVQEIIPLFEEQIARSRFSVREDQTEQVCVFHLLAYRHLKDICRSWEITADPQWRCALTARSDPAHSSRDQHLVETQQHTNQQLYIKAANTKRLCCVW